MNKAICAYIKSYSGRLEGGEIRIAGISGTNGVIHLGGFDESSEKEQKALNKAICAYMRAFMEKKLKEKLQGFVNYDSDDECTEE